MSVKTLLSKMAKIEGAGNPITSLAPNSRDWLDYAFEEYPELHDADVTVSTGKYARPYTRLEFNLSARLSLVVPVNEKLVSYSFGEARNPRESEWLVDRDAVFNKGRVSLTVVNGDSRVDIQIFAEDGSVFGCSGFELRETERLDDDFHNMWREAA